MHVIKRKKQDSTGTKKPVKYTPTPKKPKGK